MEIGILALQGAVQPHKEKLESLGVRSRLVRKPDHLTDLQGIILPGGESTAMVKLLKLNHLWEPLKEFASKHPTFGVCAGAILMAAHVSNPSQESLGLLDLSIERNAYGRQLQSTITADIAASDLWWGRPVKEAVFIRAPRMHIPAASNVSTLLSYKGDPILVSQGHLLAATFHPELSQDKAIHEAFVNAIEPR